MSASVLKAKLKSEVPLERLKFISGDKNDIPRAGDIVELDQGYTDDQGQAMVLAYTEEERLTSEWQLEVYESELEKNYD